MTDDVLTIAPFRVEAEMHGLNFTAIEVTSYGDLIADGKTIATVDSAGDVRVGSSPYVRIDHDGRLWFADKPDVPFEMVIGPDGTIAAYLGALVRYRSDGVLVGRAVGYGAPGERLIYHGPQSARRTATLALLVAFLIDDGVPLRLF